MSHTCRVLRAAGTVSLRDFFAMYSIRTYMLAWIPRIVSALLFYGLFAHFIGGTDLLSFVLLGNIVNLAASTTIVWVTASITWELRAATLPLILTSPSNPLLILVGRNVGMGLHGYLSGIVGIIAIAPVVGSVDVAEWILCGLVLLITTMSAYCFGLFLGAISLHGRALRNVISNLATGLMLVVCGVNYPVDFLPEYLHPISHALPMTHSLQAIRGITGSSPIAPIGFSVLLEVLVAATYLGLALLTLNVTLHRSRSDGSLELY